MYLRPVALILAAALLGSCAYQGVVVERNVRELPFSETVGMPGSFTFLLRDSAGAVHRQMVTPEVFANYEVGDVFNDTQPAPVHHQMMGDKQMLTASRDLSEHTRRVASHSPTAQHKKVVSHSKTKSRKSHRAIASHKRNSHRVHKKTEVAKAKRQPAPAPAASAPSAASAEIVDIGGTASR